MAFMRRFLVVLSMVIYIFHPAWTAVTVQQRQQLLSMNYYEKTGRAFAKLPPQIRPRVLYFMNNRTATLEHMPKLDLNKCELTDKDLVLVLKILQEMNVPQWLTNLDLSENKLTKIPPHCFDGFRHIKVLDLARNTITKLEKYCFYGLWQLTSLWLNDNQIKNLDLECFDGMADMNGITGLEDLYLNNNQLTTVPQLVFSKLNNLWRLSLNDNNLETLPNGCFTGLKNLQELNLNNNNLTNKFTRDYFDGLNKLGTLNLSNNENIPKNLNLEELGFVNNGNDFYFRAIKMQ